MIPYALLLLLLHASTTVAEAPSPPTIDWTECTAKIAHCSMLTKCLDPRKSADPDQLEFARVSSILPDAPCDVGTSIRPISEKVWLLKILVTGRSIDPAKGVHVYYGTKLIAGCELPADGPITVTGDTVQPELDSIDGPSRLNSEDAYCSILMRDASTLSILAKDKLVIRYFDSNEAPVDISAIDPAKNFQDTKDLATCDPISITSDPAKMGKGLQKHRIPETVLLGKTINCDATPGSKLYVGSDETTGFTCNAAKKVYEYDKDGAKIEVKPTDEVFCAIPIDETCMDLPNGDKPKLVTDNKKKTLKCPSNQQHMLINNNFYLDGKVTCENNIPEKPNEGTWFVRQESSPAVPLRINTALCSDQKLCTLAAPYKSEHSNITFAAVRGDNQNVTCSNSKLRRLEVVFANMGITHKVHPTEISCDFTTGVYVMQLEDGTKDPITKNHNIYCVRRELEVKPAQGNAGLIAAIYTVPVVLFVIALSFIGYRGRKDLIWFLCPNRAEKETKPEHNVSSLPPISDEGGGKQNKSKSLSTKSALAKGNSSAEERGEKKAKTKPRRRNVKFPEMDTLLEDHDKAANTWDRLSVANRIGYIRWCIMRRPPDALAVTKEDEVKKEDVKKEDVKKEEVKREEGKKEEVKKEEVKKEEVKKEEVKKEEKREAGGKEPEKSKTESKTEKNIEVKKSAEEKGKGGKKKGGKSGKKKPKRKRMRGKRTFKMVNFMNLVEVMFNVERDPVVWFQFLPYLFFVERAFFHSDQTTDHNVPEKDKLIPGFCYERLRLYLLHFVNDYFEPKSIGDEQKPDDEPGEAFFRGILWILKYKLNVTNKEAREAVVERASEIFNKKTLAQEDDSRFAIWGILRHEDSASFRVRGKHERFGYGGDSQKMSHWLLDEFNELRKQPLDPRPPGGSKMQHVLFALGCSLERAAMYEVWKVMKEDKRFIAADFMWAMYGRDWVWDGAWVAICQSPPEHHTFCERFTQECREYEELTEMCIRYWADTYSDDAKDGYCFEGFMHNFNNKYKCKFLRKWYTFYAEFEVDITLLGKAMNEWLLTNDKREIDGYTPVGEALDVEAKEKWEKKSDLKELAKLANFSGGRGGGGVEKPAADAAPAAAAAAATKQPAAAPAKPESSGGRSATGAGGTTPSSDQVKSK